MSRRASDTPNPVRSLRRLSIQTPSYISTPAVSIADVVVSHVARLVGFPVQSIDTQASFIGLGGHSLLAVKLAALCKKDGVKLTIANILLSSSIIEICSSASFLAPVAASPTARRRSSVHLASTPPDSPSGSPHMTEMQLSFLQSYIKNPGSNIINFYETYKICDIPAMKAAWKAVIESEPIFRMSFGAETDQSQGASLSPFKWNDIVCDSHEHYQAELVKDKAPSHIECSFDCITNPISSTSTIVWRVHHAYIDGMSAQLVYEKARMCLMGHRPTSGADFNSVSKGVQSLQHASRESNQAFWRHQIEKHPQPVGELALKEPKVPASAAAIENVSFVIPINRISAAARNAGVSLAGWYQAAWAMALSLYSDSSSVVFGTVLSGRNLPLAGADDTIGPLINTLPFHVTIDPTQTVTDFLQLVFAHSVALQNVQFSSPEDGYTRSFSSALAMEFDMEASDEHHVKPVGTSWFRVIPDMPLSVYLSAKGTLRLCFKPSKYSKQDMELLADHYRRAILLLSKKKTTCMGDLMSRLLTKGSKETLMRFGNCNTEDTSLSSIKDDLVTLFEKAARENPDAIAVEKGDLSLTYLQLAERSGMVASALKKHIAPGEVVCVHADRSINWIVAMYGVLRAGGVYSAQDSALRAHIRSMNFETAGANIFLVPGEADKTVKPEVCQLCLSVDELLETEVEPVAHRPAPRQDDNAYLCFTSGSTGKPKGVMCHHAGLVAFQRDLEVRLFAAPGQKIAQVMSPAFDGSIHEIFSALSYGATLVLNYGADPFAALRRSNAATLTPSVAKVLDPEDFPELKTVYVVGEPVPQYVNDIWSAATNMYNMYGPTEATCGATIQRLRPGLHVTIGPPNPTTRVYILDRNQQLAPPGVIGEIYCAGVQVARGYMGRPDLTAEKFLPDTIYPGRTGEMMYRTGDRGFFNHAGEVECLGRNDRQIKLRGYRTDLNDIEMRVAQAIKESTAVAICQKEDYLVAMMQPEMLNIADVRTRISRVLPTHAIPRMITAVSKFPMTPAGKLDYKEIAARSGVAVSSSTNSNPLLPTEKLVAQVWRELLALAPTEEFTKTSNFAELGGHSVLQIRLTGRLCSVFKIEIPMAKVIQCANLAEMAAKVDQFRSRSNIADPSPKSERLGAFRVSPIEAEWFEKYEIKQGCSAFNVTFATKLNPELVDIDHLTTSWNAVLARHQIFRSNYHRDESLPERVRRSYARYAPQVEQVDHFYLSEEVNRPFNLQRECPIRIFISHDTMLVCMSHIIADLTTLQVVLKEVVQFYDGCGLPKLQRKYADVVTWNRPATASQLQWWQEYLQGCNTVPHNLSHLPKRTSYDGLTRYTHLPKSLAQQVFQYSTTTKTTLHQMALASVSLALQRESNSTDIVLGAPYFNRQAEDLETVGLFLEPLPIRITHSEDSASTFIQDVQKCSQSAIANAIPWIQLLACVGETQHNFPNHALLDIMVTFHDDRGSPKLSMEGLKPLIACANGSKFLLLVEFTAIADDCVVLRLEYDNTQISKTEIARVEATMLKALESISAETGYNELKKELREFNDKVDDLSDGEFFDLEIEALRL
ncbi:acetyl-CoA synthetase-like protein [Paraphaeosphaeria sporulosa]|uniref:Acetyl-CoA synthetase-like protein n=1 Tax=Paraphaeosphaeria sporulosa TaxID=1460663 RepID=A0A177CNT2_9PLEO|nr:acetyl-CoA synthetase-like protein [Paraphaeosphaeria sporulosa]OAG08642.1 acetyl-CoA synthetase-like protein [Paraphaeosphaeria sporulosa]